MVSYFDHQMLSYQRTIDVFFLYLLLGVEDNALLGGGGQDVGLRVGDSLGKATEDTVLP